jgi:hypothetical protein
MTTRSDPVRTATVTLPFVTAQFRVPEVDLDPAVRMVHSSVPSRSAPGWARLVRRSNVDAWLGA